MVDKAQAYRDFWADVGATFPDLHGARSTTQYRQDEEALFRAHLAPLEGLRLLKTDLWDEARNTHILRWAAAAGSHAFGVDISPGVVWGARQSFERRGLILRGVLSDVRALPFQTESFDAIYSMGTVEHFAETEEALRELYRVLRPGGRAIIGVPNRFDPFLRPLLVTLLYPLGLYGYGFEKSYSRRRSPPDAQARRFRRDGRDRNPLHPRVAAHARSGLPCVGASARPGHGSGCGAVSIPFATVPVAAPARLSAGDGRGAARAPAKVDHRGVSKMRHVRVFLAAAALVMAIATPGIAQHFG